VPLSAALAKVLVVHVAFVVEFAALVADTEESRVLQDGPFFGGYLFGICVAAPGLEGLPLEDWGVWAIPTDDSNFQSCFLWSPGESRKIAN